MRAVRHARCTFSINTHRVPLNAKILCVVPTVYPFAVFKMRFAAPFLPLLAIVVCSTKFCVASVELKLQFVNDFITNENSSLATVVRASCWSRFDMVRFAMKSRTSVQFIESTTSYPEFPVNDLANQLIFFVDMSCTDSVQFLFQVCSGSLRSNRFVVYVFFF